MALRLPQSGAMGAEKRSEKGESRKSVVICQQSLVKCQLSLSKLDIRRAPPNWLQSEPFQLKAQGKQPGWTKLWCRSSSLANEKMRQDCFSVMTLLEYAFAPNDGTCGPDFIGAAKCLKQLFSIPYTEKEVSLLIHRVGKTMLICSMKPSEYRQAERYIQHGQQMLISLETPTTTNQVKEAELDVSEKPSVESRLPGETLPVRVKKKNKIRLDQKDLESKFLYYSAAEASTKDVSSAEQDSNPQWNGGFRRTLRWSFQDMCLLVGSNLLLCEDESINETEFSVRLHDAALELSSSQCLEYYLDNRLAGVDTLALCLHSGGLVAEYQLIKTDDIPLLAEQQSCTGEPFRKKKSFSQVEEKAAKLLKFLGDRCDPERCYWLFKDSGNHSFVRLLELTLHTNENRWVYNMAMLCYRVAQQHSSSSSQQDVCRQRELLLKSLELLDGVAHSNGPARYVLRAALHEQIANNYYKSISSLGKEEAQQKEAVRCINFALAHWQNVGTFLREEKRRESEAAEPLDSLIEEFHFRMEKQVLACNTQLCLKRSNLGQDRQAAETLIDGLRRAVQSSYTPDLRLAVEILGDTLLQLSKRVAARDVVVSSSINEFFSSFEALQNLLQNTGLTVEQGTDIAQKEGGDGEELAIAQKLCLHAIGLYEASKQLRKGRELRTDYKIGNAWNELGKFQLSCGDYYLAKASYELGLQTFQRHGDCLNAVACLCNLNHLERTLGFSATKGTYEGMAAFQPFDRAIQHIELALSFIASLDGNGTGDRHIVKVWKQRVNMELAMTRLIKGCRLHEACVSLVEVDPRLVQTLHKTLASELHGALSIYEFYGEKNELSRKQTAAVHFHLGKHYNWCAQTMREGKFQSFVKASTKRTMALGETHLKLALSGFTADSPEYKECSLLLQTLSVANPT